MLAEHTVEAPEAATSRKSRTGGAAPPQEVRIRPAGPAPDTAATQHLMNAAVGRGDGDLDHSGLIRTVKALSGK